MVWASALLLTAACAAETATGDGRRAAPAAVAETPPAAPAETPAYAVRFMGHAVPETVRVIDRFAGVLETGVEYHAIVEMAGGGTFEIVLFPEVAPNHVASFVSLARNGFYDGVTFHRVLDGFMAQGGDPTGTGGGGPGYELPAEFSEIPFARGIVGAARGPDPNSAGSQFFIMFARHPSLDRLYTVFGRVVRGMEVVDAIRRRDPDRRPGYAGDAMRTIRIVEARRP
jgi:cyclophilin family peptidyl-prolyl cis-trans isomerase